MPWPVIYAIDHPPGRRPERLRERPPGVPVPVGPRERKMMPLRTTTIRLVLGCLLWAAFAASGGRPAWGMELEGSLVHAWSLEVRNPYAGTCEEVRVRLGDAVKAGDVLAVYRLDDQDHDAIRQALRPGKLHARREELRLLDVQSQEAAARVERLEDAVRVGVESRARLEREASGLDMLDRQRAALREEIRELSENLAEERARVRRELGDVPVSSENVPWEALLRAPADGLVSDLKLGPRMEMVKNKLCFSVARPIFHAECRIGPDRYVRLTAGDTGRVTIQSLGDREFEGVLLPLPLTAEDKGPAAASYLVHFLIKDLDLFVSEGVRVKVVLDK